MNPAIVAIVLELAFKYAPSLVMDFVELFSKAEPTQADKDALTAKLTKLMDPAQYYQKPPTP